MTLRELRVLVSNLPPDSATVRAMRGHNWGDAEYMLADLLDVVKFHRVEWAYSRGARPPKPKPTARPQVHEQGQGVSERELARAAHSHILDQVGLGSDEHEGV